ncbi:MAG: diguanylate cyclase [Frankiales bacterium]|nr:diguanylate cyclase [Frankiales bacterium]
MTRVPGTATWRDTRVWDRTADPQRTAGRLAAVLFLLAGIAMVGTIGFLPPDVDLAAVWATTAAALATSVLFLLLPWSRMPRWTTLVPHVWGQVLIGGALGAWAGAVSHYLLFWALAALYAGLTQPPRSSLYLAPITLGSAFVALAGAEPASVAVDLIGAALLSVVVGEVLSVSTSRSQTATSSTQALLHAVTALHEAGTETTAADLVAELAHTLLSPDAVVVMVATAPGSPLYANRGQRGVDAPLGSLVVDAAARSGIGLALQEGRAIFVGDAPMSPLLARSVVARLGFASCLFIPVPGEGGYLGCVVVGWHEPREVLDEFSQQVVSLLSHQAGALLERLRSVGRLEVQASTDALTGLANRRVFLEALDRLRPGGAVVFLDLDHFKRLNDTEGHAAGDAVLVAFGKALRSCVREGDCAARYGGEEFALVLPSAASVDMTGAAQVVVQRLLEKWDGPVTFSVGIATHRQGDAPSTTLARADAAVYEAKARGRDTVVLAGAESVSV